MPLQLEYATLERERPRLLRELAEVRDAARFVLVKGDTIYGPWDTCSDCRHRRPVPVRRPGGVPCHGRGRTGGKIPRREAGTMPRLEKPLTPGQGAVVEVVVGLSLSEQYFRRFRTTWLPPASRTRTRPGSSSTSMPYAARWRLLPIRPA